MLLKSMDMNGNVVEDSCEDAGITDNDDEDSCEDAGITDNDDEIKTDLGRIPLGVLSLGVYIIFNPHINGGILLILFFGGL